MKNVVVTGPTGAIGVALIKELLDKGEFVTAVIRPGSKRKNNLPSNDNLRIVECDMADYSKLPELIAEPQDVFFHLAWEGTTSEGRNNQELQISNISNSLKAVKAAYAMGSKVFVGIGSQAEYGRVNEKLCSDTKENPVTEYGKAKLICGNRTREYCQEKGIRHIWARVLSVYGPCDWENSLVMSVIKSLLNNNCPSVTKGEQIWDYLYSKDCARALILLSETGIDGKTYVIGSGEEKTLREYIEIIGQNTNPEIKIEYGKKEYAPNQVMYLCADISELKKDTGFEAEIAFEDGIKTTINWVKENQG